jgi:hypothetical protein
MERVTTVLESLAFALTLLAACLGVYDLTGSLPLALFTGTPFCLLASWLLQGAPIPRWRK